jgi:arabinogalactan oligomer/maltooligosaccharide transport system permease protein
VTATVLKITGLAVLNAIGVYAALTLAIAGEWGVVVAIVVTTLILDWIYLGNRSIPAKYLAPGIVLLVIFQLFTFAFSIYIALTNYGDGHLGSKSDAISALTANGMKRVEGSAAYDLTILDRDGTLRFLVTDPQLVVSVGDAATPLTVVTDAILDEDGEGIGLPGHTALAFRDILQRQGEVLAVSVPVGADPAAGALRTSDGRTAYVYRSTLVYDASRDAMVDLTTGVVYPDNGQGAFESQAGQVLLPGWRAVVGLENFARIIQTLGSSTTLLGVFAWTFVFAFLSVVMAAAVGIFLALTVNDPRLRGRRLYRLVVILPYAFPAFLSITIWSGLLSTKFGFINQVLLGGADIPWLTDPWIARFSVLMVGLWLAFPYYFLIATGAIQSLPAEVEEAARIDGAGRWQLFRGVRMPLLLISMAPLLVADFAASFNNFSLIWLLNKGGPNTIGAEFDLGATDILISAVYRIAFIQPVKDYGLASAFAAIVFLIVGVIAIWGFRRTRRYEEIL